MKKVLRSPMVTVLLLLTALLLLTVGSIGGARAALNIQSDIYTSQFSLSDIGVALTEEGAEVASRNYNSIAKNGQWFGNDDGLYMNAISSISIPCMVERAGDSSFQIGKTYPLALGVKNTGSIPEYVRVTVYKYWVDSPMLDQEHGVHGWFDGRGSKKQNLDPSLIEIIWDADNPSAAAAPGWSLDKDSGTSERTVFYYNGILNPGGTAQFAGAVRISEKVLQSVKEVKEGNTVKYVYAYDGRGFVIEAQVDAVQTRHADNARTSAWGRIGAAG